MINKVLLAVDNFEHSGNALQFMQRMQSCIANVMVLTVVDNAFALGRSGLRLNHAERDEYPAALREEALAQKQLGQVTMALNEMGFNAQGLLAAGVPIEVIPEKMVLFNCDLLIISHRHLSSLGRWLNASVTRGLLDEMRQPVLVIPR
ncbi:Universal stress protein family [Serratia proteamaculans]|uniref:Universal stress protein n=1 Tax=Serratia proteamaculans TaxID=28151 RepID=A0ABS0TSE4_SERPR|nr:universal stress protein [Serratia proteamaculans]KAB1494075.1 universal stress protein [Serratia proteamaculans]MBI6180854.1 universal stress protein [Serratia proteamaculans]RYM54818.1 universal stress protein UspA [Serratia proteamaculans]CAI1025303.1 Universal stress protein family [Serratia proteamaculans]CAI1135847.1 Universal stress protein family [Serratia proteamaculans]